MSKKDRAKDTGAITAWLAAGSSVRLGAYAIFASFCTYFSMYAYRKAFVVGMYEGQLNILGALVQTKVAFIIAQLLGYTASKFWGIKFISELPGAKRAGAIVFAIVTAESFLGLFAVAPNCLAVLCLFGNGLALGVVWGLVFGFLEGRRNSDVLGAGLAASFIVASGVVKSVGKVVLGWGIDERSMPAVTGLLFLLPIALSTALLAQLPPPSAEDERWRLPRRPMLDAERKQFFLTFAPGLVALTAAYVLLSVYRDFRDNFARELWDALGYADTPSILATAEIPVALGALLAVGSIMVIKDSGRALLAVHALLLMGVLMIGGSTLLFQAGLMGPAAWMITVGLGLYLGYVPYNCVLFDRMLPAVGTAGTAGFMIYLSDSLGYLGSSGVLVYKNFAAPQLPWLEFMTTLSALTAGACLILFGLSALYFGRRMRVE